MLTRVEVAMASFIVLGTVDVLVGFLWFFVVFDSFDPIAMVRS